MTASFALPKKVFIGAFAFDAERRQLIGGGGSIVNAVVSPGSPPGRALIRTSYMATHTTAHLTRALEAFRKVGREMGLVS